jgi:hypothetical protein
MILEASFTLIYDVHSTGVSYDDRQWNSTLLKHKQLFEYQHLVLLRDIWWSKF